MPGVEAIAQEVLTSGKPAVLAANEELVFRPPKAIAWQRVGSLGAVLFVVQDTKDGHYRALSGLYELTEGGAWFERRQSGNPWRGELPERPPYVSGKDLFDVSGTSVGGGEDEVIYMVQGQAVEACHRLSATTAMTPSTARWSLAPAPLLPWAC